jgi:23S rRNA pseudouridine955/2504/2580 synthase/23S rRNA pseudouridine1911/1915/1917 synthase
VLCEDADLLAVNKPAGLPTIPGRGNETSLIELLRQRDAGAELRLVHRIDVGTSGVVILARHPDAQRGLVRAFVRREVEKEYWAIIPGVPTERSGRIDAPIQQHPRRKEKMRVHPKGRSAVTEWEVIESWAGYSLLRCRPLSGRRHQIRVHLAHVGMPLAVDPLYGSGEGIFLSRLKPGYKLSRTHPEYPLIGRLTLHARSIRLAHPRSGEPFSAVAEPPKDFRATINQLRRLAAAESSGAAGGNHVR